MTKKKMKNKKESDIKRGLIGMLRDSPGNFISGEAMSKVFGISRAAVWKHIESLRRGGYEIESFPRKGYKLKSRPETLDEHEIRKELKTITLGQAGIHCFMSIVSTNETACALAAQGASEGTVVTAESQTGGKGRLGRSWMSPEGGLYFSIILRPEMRIDEIPAMTLVFASAVAKAISGVSGSRTMIKWPNDIFIGDKKVCGILAETRAQPDRTDFIVIGIGVNVNTAEDQIPITATSLKAESGNSIDRSGLLKAILESVEEYYLAFKEKGFLEFRDEVRGMSKVLGKSVQIETRGGSILGTAIDIDEIGALIVKDSQGRVHRIFSGDVIMTGQG